MRAKSALWPAVALILSIALALSGCGRTQTGQVDMPTRPIEEVLADHTDSLMSIPGVVGTAQSLCNDADCIKVYVEQLTDEIREKIPSTIEGYPVDIEATGAFQALPEE